MKIIRARKSAAIDYIAEHLDPAKAEIIMEKDAYLEALKQMLQDAGDSIFLVIVFDEKSEVAGFLLAVAEPARPFTFVQECWTRPSFDDTLMKQRVLQGLVTWTQNQGRNEIRMETRRNSESFNRRTKYLGVEFKPHSMIMSYSLAIEDETLFDGVSNEQRISTENRVNADGIAAEDRDNVDSSVRETSQQPERIGGDSVQGAAGGSSGTAVPASPGSLDGSGEQLPGNATSGSGRSDDASERQASV